MSKFKVGDKVIVVDAASVYDTYKNGDTGVVVAYDLCPAVSGHVRREDGVIMNVYWSEVELIEGGQDSHGAEAIRSSILEIRSKREALHKELLQLDGQEKEAVEKLKEQGFILYEENVSKEVVATTNKAALYAEDIEEDMTDPENWEVGDLVECLVDTIPDTSKGGVYKIMGVDKGEIQYIHFIDEVGDGTNRVVDGRFKFHSRPVK